MARIVSLKERYYLRSVSIFLITAVLLAGIVSCGPSGPSECIDNDGDGYGAGEECLGPDCDDNDPLIYPGATDEPDDSFVDSNCDGIDGETSRAIFVAPSGDDSNAGTGPVQPMYTIQAGIDKAKEIGRDYVLVSEGTYVETITLQSNVSVYGGYSAAHDWERSQNYTTVIEGDEKAITGSNIVNVTLNQLDIRSTDAGYGDSSYGIFLTGSSEINIEKCTIAPGDGGSGTDGSDGTNGAGGGNGLDGQPGCEHSGGVCSTCDQPLGGDGGNSLCGRYGGEGGDAGHGSGSGESGESGIEGTPGGEGGSSEYDGGPGVQGIDGLNGSSGSGGDNFGNLTASGYVPANGLEGTPGPHGNGGGGGGGGGGGDDICDSYGSSGGGGGGGGCGGTKGSGGNGGGGSFAIWLYDCSNVKVENCIIQSGIGGNGGAGGIGGSGGAGGNGGDGGAYGGAGEQGDGGMGAAGGNGGSGGNGGHGGGGGGGPSIGIVSFNTTLNPDFHTQNVFVASTGGVGGSSLDIPGAGGIYLDYLIE